MDNVLYFRSFPENFVKERDGRKPNTLRKLPDEDYRNDIIKKWENGESILIEITDTEDLHSFVREVTDVTKWDGWTIISWKHDALHLTNESYSPQIQTDNGETSALVGDSAMFSPDKTGDTSSKGCGKDLYIYFGDNVVCGEFNLGEIQFCHECKNRHKSEEVEKK